MILNSKTDMNWLHTQVVVIKYRRENEKYDVKKIYVRLNKIINT